VIDIDRNAFGQLMNQLYPFSPEPTARVVAITEEVAIEKLKGDLFNKGISGWTKLETGGALITLDHTFTTAREGAVFARRIPRKDLTDETGDRLRDYLKTLANSCDISPDAIRIDAEGSHFLVEIEAEAFQKNIASRLGQYSGGKLGSSLRVVPKWQGKIVDAHGQMRTL